MVIRRLAAWLREHLFPAPRCSICGERLPLWGITPEEWVDKHLACKRPRS